MSTLWSYWKDNNRQTGWIFELAYHSIPKGYRDSAGGECDEYYFLGGSYMAANGSDGVYPHPDK